MAPNRERGLSRRDFVTAAVAIGGTSALTACMQRERTTMEEEEGTPTEHGQSSSTEFPRGDLESVPSGQHRWGEYLVRDAHGNTVPPQQLVTIGLEYEGSFPPTDAEREQVTQALETLERAFQWGTGGNAGAMFNRGLLFMMGYAPRYFEAMGQTPDSLTTPEDVLDAVGEDPAKADPYDAILLLTSDVGSIVLSAEEALFGELDEVNGVPVDATFDGVFSKGGRHTGLVGKGLPADELEEDRIPEDAPLSMGFKSGFRDNLPKEDAVTLSSGPFAGGTTIASSTLLIDLDRWYDQDADERVAEMFCPAHTTDEVGPVGDKLGSDSGITEADVDRIEEDAESHGCVGHTQKVARARDGEFEPRILRRAEGVATNQHEGAGFEFNSVQRTMDDFVETRNAMNPDEYDFDIPAENHGIVDYLETLRRGAYLAPPREKRALPVV
ncbi:MULTISPECIES: hypothetical protein [Haloferax]|uniref:Tat (Twin-arginine translocation) pathway signal sequence domain-containing protein n=1 Tax=Haloferax marinum TaxID=2666143 RepID=A0A6A8G715_9EURY|nr:MULTISPECIES: hypothetical protein [Haloferax]KAB1197834.1 hypothetical protein Hfx1150_10000 [Haloferax sp. CBA1150]MRW96894.1 hypothetical protein [Haloferax marinum]